MLHAMMLHKLNIVEFLNTIFVLSHYVLREPRRDPSNRIGSMNMGYVSDTARIRTPNLFHPECAPISLYIGHSDRRTGLSQLSPGRHERHVLASELRYIILFKML